MAGDTAKFLSSGFQTAFIDKAAPSELKYRPRFLYNDSSRGIKLLGEIERQLQDCDHFTISVAFITQGGLIGLLPTLEELNQRGIKGRILTTDYQTFTEPKALRALEKLPNIELRLFQTDNQSEGFHTKGYIFEKEGLYRIIIGSSNMTDRALTCNKEWNALLQSTDQGEIVYEILGEFDRLWKSKQTVVVDQAFIEHYEERYRQVSAVRANQLKGAIEKGKELKPNSMQSRFVYNLNYLVNVKKVNKALLVSATGTGKTYASAFAMRDLQPQPKRVLFVVHREQIAKKSLESYRKIFTGENSRSFGLVSGSHREFEADFVFATMQTLCKPENLAHYDKKAFDIIIIDEVHRAGSESYNRIMDYFEPKLWLGMSATPYRMQGPSIFELFDHNVAQEITLEEALEDDLLCPFHYFGIADLSFVSDSASKDDFTNFNRLTSQARVEHILEKAEFYGFSGERVKGLIFCSRQEEARELKEAFALKGYRCETLFGSDSIQRREQCINRLVGPECDEALDYLLTVDVFNEGIDIPEVNQVIMIRATESPIIFVQQLGRGLRKARGKEFVVVLDFIGNYSNNYMIPIALSGDRSYNKDTLRRLVTTGNSVIYGPSTVHFDEVSKKRIFAAIDNAKTNSLALLRQAYQQLKDRLGRVPRLEDFEENGSIEATKILDQFGAYHLFLQKVEKANYRISLSDSKVRLLTFIGKKLAKGKRVEELALLNIASQNLSSSTGPSLMNALASHLASSYKLSLKPAVENSVINQLTQFADDPTKRKTFGNVALIEKDAQGNWQLAPTLKEWLQTDEEFARQFKEVVDFGIKRYETHYKNGYKGTAFVLYEKYTYEDVCRLLNWSRSLNAQNIGGYFYDKETKTLPVFINYEKGNEAIPYEDRFISEGELIALSKHPRKVTSPDADHFFKRTPQDQDNRIFLFVRKNKDDKEAKEFYFLGEINAYGDPIPVKMPESNDDAFEIQYRLDKPVRADIYEYITKG